MTQLLVHPHNSRSGRHILPESVLSIVCDGREYADDNLLNDNLLANIHHY